MKRHFWISTILAVTLAGGVQAQGFDGAEISIETLAFSDDSDFGSTNYRGGLQFGLFGGAAIEGDLSYYGFRALGLDARNGTIHGIYTLNPVTTVGLFAGQDSLEDADATIYGLEGAGSFGGTTVEGYFAQVDGDLAEGTILGVNGSLTLGNKLGLTAAFGTADIGVQVNRIALGGEYRMSVGPVIFAEFGQIEAESDSETYVTVGARLAIGPNQGVTFGSRSIFDIVPGL